MKTLRTKSKNLLGVKAFLIKHGYNTRAKVKSLIQEGKLNADPSIVQELREWCGLDKPAPVEKKSTVKAKPKKKKPKTKK